VTVSLLSGVIGSFAIFRDPTTPGIRTFAAQLPGLFNDFRRPGVKFLHEKQGIYSRISGDTICSEQGTDPAATGIIYPGRSTAGNRIQPDRLVGPSKRHWDFQNAAEREASRLGAAENSALDFGRHKRQAADLPIMLGRRRQRRTMLLGARER
jgi:hypothetical protein